MMGPMATIVGQAPGRRGGPPLRGPCGARLARLAGLSGVDELARRHELANLLPRFPGKRGKGDAFPPAEARRAAHGVRPKHRDVLLLGRHVARAFGVDRPFFEWWDLGRWRVAVVPHPSGVSRWWNDSANRARAAAFLREALG